MKFYILIALLSGYVLVPDIYHENNLPLSLALFVALLVDFIQGFGKRIHPLDLMGLYAALTYMLAPSLSYYLAEIEWYVGYNVMCIPKEQYLSVAMPGTFMVLVGLNFPFKEINTGQIDYYDQIKEYLKDKTDAGFKLFWIGFAANFLLPFMPGGLGFFMELASQLIYIGGLYLWFSPMEMKKKLPYLIVMLVLPLARTLREGMFGELVFWTVFMAMIMLLKYRVAFWKKLLMAVSGLIFMLFIQSIKYEYRTLTWYTDEAGTETLSYKLNVFQNLWQDRLDNPDMLYGPFVLSNALDRTNQGGLTAMAIRYVPDYEPYAKGETIFLATAASFIPRFLWPNKPTVGGREKMIRFTGFDNGEITSMDIGQLGDAYVNFGTLGGAVFMFIYGLVFAFFFSKIFEIGRANMLSLTLWIPLFYVGVVTMDSSVLASFNHLIKSGMFAYIFFIGYKKFFKSDL